MPKCVVPTPCKLGGIYTHTFIVIDILLYQQMNAASNSAQTSIPTCSTSSLSSVSLSWSMSMFLK